MSGEKIGEPILLIWEGWPEEFFVKGHLSAEDALAALNQEELLEKFDRIFDNPSKDWKDRWYKPVLGPALHRYARWSMEPGPEGCAHVLRDYSESGRGRFPITKFAVLEWQKVDGPIYKPEVRELTI
jgi:hypothetical protein